MKKINAKYSLSFKDFLADIDNIEKIEIPENYILVENGYTKKKTKVQKSKQER
jgi:hypothetical protein